MDIIPLIKLRNRKILNHSLEKILTNKNLEKEKPLYLLDYDGIEHNKPNICIYQKLSKHFDLWVDNAVKNLGDVVDSFMSGAKSIVIRLDKYPKFNPVSIKDISENKIFLNITNFSDIRIFDSYNEKIDGFVSLMHREDVENNFKYLKVVNEVGKKLYNYEENPANISFWNDKEIKGLLVAVEKIKRFK